MEELCRVCLSSTEPLEEIFSKCQLPREEPSLAEMLTECVDYSSENVKGATSCFGNELNRPKMEEQLSQTDMVQEGTDASQANYPMFKEQMRNLTEKPPVPHSCLVAPGEKATDHMQTTDKTTYECMQCWKTFDEKGTLNRHMRTHRNECPHCLQVFSTRSNLRRHIRIHTGERPYKCSYCPMAFTDHSDAQKHIRSHTGERPFKCPHCPMDFMQKPHLNNHIKRHASKDYHSCQHCSMIFKTVLKNHVCKETLIG
ncbi:oocyte zinc finger protein XlCOF19-like isoform X2 [Drosophila novamexicana]|uniref:oocyte zinc finger protein XlCOF19-like isoform X2 n=1 Tax=Drosophila novamexicana TaxID=47314 RepID=UPI0011E58E3F|nr:oocyte zinc finger protein XlCOF19-like isoform X2 [Drosophila novamexicana]